MIERVRKVRMNRRAAFMAGATVGLIVGRAVEEVGFEVQSPIKNVGIVLQNPLRLVRRPVERPAEPKE